MLLFAVAPHQLRRLRPFGPAGRSLSHPFRLYQLTDELCGLNGVLRGRRTAEPSFEGIFASTKVDSRGRGAERSAGQSFDERPVAMAFVTAFGC